MSLAPTVMIDDIDKAELLVELYNNAKAFNNKAVRVFRRSDALQLLSKGTTFQKLYGRHLWVDLSRDDKVNLLYYNRYNGLNAGQSAIRAIREKRRFK